MNKTMFLLVVMAFLAIPAFAVDCNQNYNTCITQCCSNCGSTLGTDSNGDLTCNVGTQDNPNQACIQACTPCSTSYKACVANQGDVTFNTNRTGCCASAFVLLAGLGFAIRGKI